MRSWHPAVGNYAQFRAALIVHLSKAMDIQSFRDLQVWQRSMALALDVYRVALHLPDDEKFGMRAQLKRAVVSIPSNIAEGSAYGWRSRRNLHHLGIALGSALELQTQLLLAERLQLTPPERVHPILAHANEVGRMLNGLIRSIERRAPDAHS